MGGLRDVRLCRDQPRPGRVIEGILGGDVPAFRYAAGAGLGAILSFSGLGGIGVLIGLGFYMPFNIILTYTIGCGLRIWIDRATGMPMFSTNSCPLHDWIVGPRSH